jgi:hypothetical protein
VDIRKRGGGLWVREGQREAVQVLLFLETAPRAHHKSHISPFIYKEMPRALKQE